MESYPLKRRLETMMSLTYFAKHANMLNERDILRVWSSDNTRIHYLVVRLVLARGGEFVLKLIGNDRLGLFVLQQGITAGPVLNADLHRTRREYPLETPQPNLSCGEGVVPYERRSFGRGHSQIGLLQRLAIKRLRDCVSHCSDAACIDRPNSLINVRPGLLASGH
jgi:hypothetical protein